MSRILVIFSFLLCFLPGCFDKKAPQVVYDDSGSDTLTIENILEDTSKVLVVGMPIYLDSTDVLLHPIGWDNIYIRNKGRSGFSPSSDFYAGERILKKGDAESSEAYDVYSNNLNFLSGEMVNLIFENIETGEQHLLTDKVMIIKHVFYLKELARNAGRHYLLYTVYDKDYNRDGKLGYPDMEAYYMSNLDGTNFTKISQDYHYPDASKLLYKNSKYYFRTIEDINKDGKFNKKDKFHYYYIDLKDDNFKPVEYFPLELMDAINTK